MGRLNAMNCDVCGGTMRFLEDQRYQYAECGLDSVYLDGVDVYACDPCGESVAVIPRIEQLHDELARAIAFKPVPLTGPEVRFLRKQLRMSARQWAAVLHVDHSTLSRWENGSQALGDRSDILVRYAFFRNLEEQTGVVELEPVSKRIAAVNLARSAPAHYVLRNVDNAVAWTLAAS